MSETEKPTAQSDQASAVDDAAMAMMESAAKTAEKKNKVHHRNRKSWLTRLLERFK